jgi:hypothetical protein
MTRMGILAADLASSVCACARTVTEANSTNRKKQPLHEFMQGILILFPFRGNFLLLL